MTIIINFAAESLETTTVVGDTLINKLTWSVPVQSILWHTPNGTP